MKAIETSKVNNIDFVVVDKSILEEVEDKESTKVEKEKIYNHLSDNNFEIEVVLDNGEVHNNLNLLYPYTIHQEKPRNSPPSCDLSKNNVKPTDCIELNNIENKEGDLTDLLKIRNNGTRYLNFENFESFR